MPLPSCAISYVDDRLIKGRLLTRVLKPTAEASEAIQTWIGPTAGVRVRPEYQPFTCRLCGRLDELACFRFGLSRTFVVPEPRPDLFVTREYLHVWSRRLAELVRGVAPDDVWFFELPADPGYVVPWPKKTETVPPGTRISVESAPRRLGEAFAVFGDPCPSCGRYPSTTFDSDEYVPTHGPLVYGVTVDVDHSPRLIRLVTWVLSGKVASLIRGTPLSNIKLTVLRHGAAIQ